MNLYHFQYILQIADNALVAGQRLGEWCGHGPALELDMALTNLSLDHFGQTRSLLQYAGEIENKGRDEDDLAYMRDSWDFRNVLLLEQPNGDFAHTIVRQFLFDRFNYLMSERLQQSRDQRLAGIASKSLKEITYHQKFSSEWTKRLGDGTEESHLRMQKALNDLWSFTGEMFAPSEADKAMLDEGVGADLEEIQESWQSYVKEILQQAGLDMPESGWMQSGGKKGQHSEHLGIMLAEMQIMQRSYPGLEW